MNEKDILLRIVKGLITMYMECLIDIGFLIEKGNMSVITVRGDTI